MWQAYYDHQSSSLIETLTHKYLKHHAGIVLIRFAECGTELHQFEIILFRMYFTIHN